MSSEGLPPVDGLDREEEGQPEFARAWMPTFLGALRQMPNVSAACRVARVSPSTAQAWRVGSKNVPGDPLFAVAWEAALEEAYDLLERIAHTRATTGWEKTIVRTRVKRDGGGNVIEEERWETKVSEVSDNLLIQMLRAGRPEKWRERPSQVGDPGPAGGQGDGGVVDDAIGELSARVVRLADRRRTAGGASGGSQAG